ALIDKFQCTTQRHVMKLHPALEDVGRAKDHANRRGKHSGTSKNRVEDGTVLVDELGARLIQDERVLFRDDCAQIPKRNEFWALGVPHPVAGRRVVWGVRYGDRVKAQSRQSNFQIRRMSRRATPIATCSASINQNACGCPERGMWSKFIPHMRLMTTNGMLSVAMTESPFVTRPRRFETCVR